MRHPERVSGLVLYGGYALGAKHREDTDHVIAYRAMQELVRIGWRKANPVFRQLFTSRFIPEGTEEQVGWFNDLCQRTTTPRIAYELLTARAEVDIRHLLPRVRTPTLVLHSERDEVVPVGEGRRLASEIPDARFVSLGSPNHVLLEHEPAWRDFKDAVLDVAGAHKARARSASRFDTLTARELEIYGLLLNGRSNAGIAAELAISEKTVRNHMSGVYRKLGVRSRAEALVLAREHDFRP